MPQPILCKHLGNCRLSCKTFSPASEAGDSALWPWMWKLNYRGRRHFPVEETFALGWAGRGQRVTITYIKPGAETARYPAPGYPIQAQRQRQKGSRKERKLKTSLQGESESEVTQSCPTLCDPVDCSSSTHGILQARVLEWAAIAFSRGSSRPRDRTRVSCFANRRFTL